MKILCLICARGGSKGIKNKNLLKISNISLIGHSIKMAKKINSFCKIVVSTDSTKIAKEAKKYGAEVPFLRPKNISKSSSAEIDAWKHAINFFKRKKFFFDAVVSLPCTSPLRKINDVKRCIKKFKTKKFNTIIAVKKSLRNPYFNIVEKKADSFFNIVIKSKKYIHNRQVAPVTFDVSTVCFISETKYILKNNNLFNGKVGVVEVSPFSALDIDNLFDYKLAKLIYEKKLSF